MQGHTSLDQARKSPKDSLFKADSSSCVRGWCDIVASSRKTQELLPRQLGACLCEGRKKEVWNSRTVRKDADIKITQTDASVILGNLNQATAPSDLNSKEDSSSLLPPPLSPWGSLTSSLCCSLMTYK